MGKASAASQSGLWTKLTSHKRHYSQVGDIAFCVFICNRLCLVWMGTLKCLPVLKSLISSVQLLGGSRPRSRPWLQLEVLRIPQQALDSLASPFTTAGLCPGVAPEIPVAWWTGIGAPQMDLEVRDTRGHVASWDIWSKCSVWFRCLSPSGGYEGYRPAFSNAPSSGYGQTQFNNSRDYSNNTYQRVSSPFILKRNTWNRLEFVTWYCCFKEGYQNYKRGAAQGPRGLSRGNAPSVR